MTPDTTDSGAALSVPAAEQAPGAASAGPAATAARRGPGAVVLRLFQKYSLVVLLGLSIAIYGIFGKNPAIFLGAADIRNILSSQAVLVVLTLGLIIPMTSGSLDLSIGNIAGLCSVATAAFYAHAHVPLLLGIVLGILVGAVFGLVNGLLVASEMEELAHVCDRVAVLKGGRIAAVVEQPLDAHQLTDLVNTSEAAA